MTHFSVPPPLQPGRKFLASLALLAILCITALIAWQQLGAATPSIKIGVLHSLIGTMAYQGFLFSKPVPLEEFEILLGEYA